MVTRDVIRRDMKMRSQSAMPLYVTLHHVTPHHVTMHQVTLHRGEVGTLLNSASIKS